MRKKDYTYKCAFLETIKPALSKILALVRYVDSNKLKGNGLQPEFFKPLIESLPSDDGSFFW